MNKKTFFKDLDTCFEFGDQAGITTAIKKHLTNVTEEDASRDLAEYIYLKFTTFKADSMAGLMQIMIHANPNTALLKFPENYLFRAAVIKGSVDLYECFIEEGIEPFLKGKDEEEVMDYYAELHEVAYTLNEKFFPEYVPCIKGMDFNGAFAKDKSNPSAVLIHGEDFETMDDVVEKYNTILGRRDIIKDLEKRMA
ncbi:hypothetical protein [Flavobacterium tegetincola]|uniref:hypothetical protein n=1 Tax=Flavobacterium tegetincola TaxID=150172 RepID=UPI000424AF1A|nr:hypothetical protein [Flavobacterium tegetincola]